MKLRLVVCAVLAGVLAAYANSFGNGFHFDDSHTVVDNPAIRSVENIPRFFTDTTTFSVLPANRTYRPLVSTTLALDYALGHGYTPLWFHIGTFVLFLVLVLCLYGLYGVLLQHTPAKASGAAGWLALGAAAWFGLHPAMAETVNYVIQRGDLYCTLGCVAALLVYAKWPKLRRAGLYLLPFAGAMLSKPPAAVFPALLLLYVYFFEADTLPELRRWRRAAVSAVPAVVATIALLLLQSAMTPKTFAPSTLSALDYRLTQPLVWARYATELFLPLHLNADTDMQVVSGMNGESLTELVVGGLFLLGLVAAIFWAARRRTLYPIAYGLLWFVITQLPTSLYPLSEVENDHRMFFSFAGLMVAVVYAGWLAWERLTSDAQRREWLPVAATAAALVLVTYGWGVHLRNKVWKDEDSLWLDDVQKCPHNGRGLMNYALTQMAKGTYPVALDYFTRALVYTPNYPTLEVNLGIVNGAMADQGDPTRNAEAERHFQRALELAPNDDTTHSFYGRWLVQHGRTAEAIAQLKTAIALDPQRPLQHDQLIQAELQAGDKAATVQAAQETLSVVPDDALAAAILKNPEAIHPALAAAPAEPPTPTAVDWINTSLAQYQQGDYARSIASAKAALKLNPKMAEAYNNIGAAYAALHQWDEAIAADEEAVRLNPTMQIAHNNLAWATSQKKLGVK